MPEAAAPLKTMSTSFYQKNSINNQTILAAPKENRDSYNEGVMAPVSPPPLLIRDEDDISDADSGCSSMPG